MDPYTPCLSRSTDVHATRRKIPRAGYYETVLRYFSGFLEDQESRIAQLMRNFDIDFEGDASCDRMGVTDVDANSFSASSPRGNPAPSPSPKLPLRHQSDKARSTQPSAPVSRPGRLSPTIIQMILSSNTSTVSGISSAADTSYDSALYQWLGVQVDTAPKLSCSVPVVLDEPVDDSGNLDISMMSSGSAYSQPSPEPRIILPLSPPATTLLPFSDTLRGERIGDSLPHIPKLSPRHLASMESHQPYDLRDFTTAMLSNNLSLQHYMPSASVLRHFQQVIDELRGLYVPSDTGNNTPNPDRARAFLSSRRSLPGLCIIPPSRVSRRSSHNPSDSISTHTHTRAGPPATTMESNMHRDTRTTRELYTEMAVMLFSQVSNEETQVTNLRNLVNRLENLAIRKRKVALVIGTRGRERC